MERLLTAAVPSQRILVITEDAELLGKLTTAVQEGGGTAIRAPALATLTAPESPQVPHRLVLFAFGGDPEELARLTAKLRASAQLVALVPSLPLAGQLKLLADAHCNHVLLQDERGLRLLTTTVRKFVSGDLFGIEKYVPEGTEVRLTRLRDYHGRQRAIDEVLEYADQVGVRRQVRNAIAQVCEELLMNALYDAPIGEDGMPLFADVDIKERLAQLSPRPVSIRYASMNNQFAVAVRDRFGRLDKSTIIRYIDKCLRSPNQIDRKTYGAGLGLYLIANAASQYVVNIAPGIATEVVCTFDRGLRHPLQALSLFVYPGAPTQQVGPSIAAAQPAQLVSGPNMLTVPEDPGKV